MPSGVRGFNCPSSWDRGLDCNFDERSFHITATVIWAATAVAFGVFTGRVAWQNRPGCWHRPTRCLIFVTAASVLRGLDHFLYLLRLVGFGTYHGIADMLVLFALWSMVQMWEDVMTGLARRQGTLEEVAGQIRKVRYVTTAICVLQCPVSLYCSLQTSNGWNTRDEWITSFQTFMYLYFTSGYLTVGFGMTFTAVTMWKCSKKIHAESTAIHRVSLLNLCEQLMYDVALVTVAALYFHPDYDKKGSLQAACFGIGTLFAVWIMQGQIVLFFLACRSSDPFRCEAELSKLLVEKPPPKGTTRAVGSPSRDGVEPVSFT